MMYLIMTKSNLDSPPNYIKTKTPQFYRTVRELNTRHQKIKIDLDFDKWDREFEAKPWSYKLPVYIARWHNTYTANWYHRFIRKPFQSFKNLKNGFGFFPDEAGFEFAACASRMVLPRLRYLRSFARNYPVLPPDKNIWHNVKPVIIKDDPLIEPGPNEVMWHDVLDDIIFFHVVVAEGNSLFLNEAGSTKYKAGKKYYSDYYESLWD
jgi:hypothetical protein